MKYLSKYKTMITPVFVVLMVTICVFLAGGLYAEDVSGIQKTESKIEDKSFEPHQILLNSEEKEAEEKAFREFVPPYKAKTVKECVFEEACMWNAFVNAIGERGPEIKDNVIHRWSSEDIKLYTLVSIGERERYVALEKEISEKLNSFSPVPIKVSAAGMTIIIIPSDDFKSSVYGRYKGIFQQAFSERFFDFFERSYAENIRVSGFEKKSLLLTFYDRNNIISSIFFIKPDYFIMNEDMRYNLFKMLGVKKYFLSNLTQDAKYNFDYLNKLILTMLYNPDIKSGMTLSQVKEKFSQLYKNSMDNL